MGGPQQVEPFSGPKKREEKREGEAGSLSLAPITAQRQDKTRTTSRDSWCGPFVQNQCCDLCGYGAVAPGAGPPGASIKHLAPARPARPRLPEGGINPTAPARGPGACMLYEAYERTNNKNVPWPSTPSPTPSSPGEHLYLSLPALRYFSFFYLALFASPSPYFLQLAHKRARNTHSDVQYIL